MFLYIGLVLLFIGILLRAFTENAILAIILILLGVSSKVYYLIGRVNKGKYKPGWELLILIIGLFLFFLGIYIKSNQFLFNPHFLIIPGVFLKVLFIVIFIKKVSR